MIVAVHQPNFLPFVGYFSKINNADIFILLDDCQFEKNDFTNRNRIKAAAGYQWITLPVDNHPFVKTVKDTKLFQYKKHSKKILAAIKINYARSLHYKEIFPELEELFLKREYVYLIDLNVALLKWVCRVMGIPTESKSNYPHYKFIYSSAIDNDGLESKNRGLASSSRLAALVRHVGGTHYLAGGDSKNYHDIKDFYVNGIHLLENKTPSPIYTQKHGDFLPNMSIIDILFNYENEYREALK